VAKNATVQIFLFGLFFFLARNIHRIAAQTRKEGPTSSFQDETAYHSTKLHTYTKVYTREKQVKVDHKDKKSWISAGAEMDDTVVISRSFIALIRAKMDNK
jgi:hypothetical protein